MIEHIAVMHGLMLSISVWDCNSCWASDVGIGSLALFISVVTLFASASLHFFVPA